MACAMILSSCSFGGKSKSSSKSDNYTTTGSAASGTYQGVIENGRYKTSKARGVTASNNDNTFNVKSFESGLTNISKKVFSTKSYIFQEGQYLSKSTVENWLGRVSKSNKTGLNPKKGKTNGTRNPVYIQSIEEQDYMKQNGNDLKLHGITVGIGLNSVDYYKKTTNGPTYSQNISDAAMKSYGQQAAQKVIKRLRQKKALKNVPIVIALYKQASDDSLVGGTFFEYSVNNGSSVGTWKKLNITNKVLPKASDATSTNSGNETDNTDFTNFKSQIQSFFPNLSGVTAQAQYENGTLSGMHITVTTQFYSETEISSFTQYISTAAQKYLPSGIPIDIKIQTSTDMQAFVYRDSGQKKFSSHVFDSY
ncbi:CamS family sex pheromone protein [Paucilactobacillus suebicus]|uniref:CamS sex pheromone cAM373 family protein n=1 Tax=Paucilactobacillus suebicus DSM 5007 = KCTC 3549 TaxID=1423807 RepID=A0A0R1WBG7_9LACO|nr:CamS family sex pheromone protein [Paucilactobacillus suebicus]KRM13316.1 CamS sex pheromone cAM373 family protein [Paucilactobacillus suebicus DSM 5007 = KCTC 3549]